MDSYENNTHIKNQNLSIFKDFNKNVKIKISFYGNC